MSESRDFSADAASGHCSSGSTGCGCYHAAGNSLWLDLQNMDSEKVSVFLLIVISSLKAELSSIGKFC